MNYVMKTAQIRTVLPTTADAQKAIDIYRKAKPGEFARTLCEEMIKPNLAEIEKRIGQKCDPMYLAYAVEFAIMDLNIT